MGGARGRAGCRASASKLDMHVLRLPPPQPRSQPRRPAHWQHMQSRSQAGGTQWWLGTCHVAARRACNPTPQAALSLKARCRSSRALAPAPHCASPPRATLPLPPLPTCADAADQAAHRPPRPTSPPSRRPAVHRARLHHHAAARCADTTDKAASLSATLKSASREAGPRVVVREPKHLYMPQSPRSRAAAEAEQARRQLGLRAWGSPWKAGALAVGWPAARNRRTWLGPPEQRSSRVRPSHRVSARPETRQGMRGDATRAQPPHACPRVPLPTPLPLPPRPPADRPHQGDVPRDGRHRAEAGGGVPQPEVRARARLAGCRAAPACPLSRRLGPARPLQPLACPARTLQPLACPARTRGPLQRARAVRAATESACGD